MSQNAGEAMGAVDLRAQGGEGSEFNPGASVDSRDRAGDLRFALLLLDEIDSARTICESARPPVAVRNIARNRQEQATEKMENAFKRALGERVLIEAGVDEAQVARMTASELSRFKSRYGGSKNAERRARYAEKLKQQQAYLGELAREN